MDVALHPLMADIFAQHGVAQRFERNASVVRQGEHMTSLYYLVHGKVKVEQAVINGKSVVVAFAGAGSWMGDLELFGDTPIANCSVSAVTQVDAIRIAMDVMRERIRIDAAVTEMFARTLARKMWAYSRLSAVNLLYPLLDRYAAYLYEMSTATVELPIALETTAGLLGASVRQLQRALRALAEAGILTRSARTLIIADRAGLMRVAGDLLHTSVASLSETLSPSI